MGYLADALKNIENDKEFIFVGTGVIVVDDQDRILMGRRTDNGEWCIPGGSLELHETLEECASRELFEETGIKSKASDMALNAAKFIQSPINKNGRNIYVVSISFVVLEYDDSELYFDSREFSKYGWFNSDEIRLIFDKITPYTREGLMEYFKKRSDTYG